MDGLKCVGHFALDIFCFQVLMFDFDTEEWSHLPDFPGPVTGGGPFVVAEFDLLVENYIN